jgi:hypothetical protein
VYNQVHTNVKLIHKGLFKDSAAILRASAASSMEGGL